MSCSAVDAVFDFSDALVLSQWVVNVTGLQRGGVLCLDALAACGSSASYPSQRHVLASYSSQYHHLSGPRSQCHLPDCSLSRCHPPPSRQSSE